MFKKLVSISLIIAILITLVRFTIPYLWYYSNYNYISTELCIHRHSLDHDCDGTCQLKKMVQKTHDHGGDQQPILPVTQEQKINLFFDGNLAISLKPTFHSFRLAGFINQMQLLWIGEPVPPLPACVDITGGLYLSENPPVLTFCYSFIFQP